MAAGPTYEPIVTTTLGSAQGSVVFDISSVANQSYTDLVLVITNITAQINNMGISLNGDTGSNYSRTVAYGNGSTRLSSKNNNQNYLFTMYKDTDGGNPTMCISHFFNYSNGSVYKNVVSRLVTDSSGTRSSMMITGTWRSNEAITTISINSGNANFNSGANFTLYGILAA